MYIFIVNKLFKYYRKLKIQMEVNITSKKQSFTGLDKTFGV